MSVILADEQAFAQGGHRLCFVHPRHADRCIKVRRPDFTLEDLRRKKGFPKSLLPLHCFDDNREEHEVITDLATRHGEPVFDLISRCYGFETTDLGPGLVLELVRDADGRISQTLKAQIWHQGYGPDCQAAVERFIAAWRNLQIPSRDLLLHNLLVQKDSAGQVQRIVVIDGLGSPNLIPFHRLPPSLRSAKVERKLTNLQQRIEQILAKKARGDQPGYHGMATAHLPHDNRKG
ncbi:YrbL family protein [Marinobacterium weihaiense]|uniref:PhoP regulatory network YrbL family protein n=1 Tax=Marinobacterium weihaiense TaxID=2851016 RepID=A0ABS6MAF2_9GAMM|nr:YrbL family protein [Marinobacterium weihaiense]MBV0933260.1 PhoP regulatory network YrbL family protein [Marinobacterium weihaiense]